MTNTIEKRQVVEAFQSAIEYATNYQGSLSQEAAAWYYLTVWVEALLGMSSEEFPRLGAGKRFL